MKLNKNEWTCDLEEPKQSSSPYLTPVDFALTLLAVSVILALVVCVGAPALAIMF